jgi:hypothetical protein
VGIANRRAIRFGGVLLIASMIGVAGAAQPAAAEGLFEALFGSFRRHIPPPSNSYADPHSPFGGEYRRESNFGHGTVFCVRTCDGRYFPLQRHAGMAPADMCRSFCPTAKTMVFSGSRIDTAVAQNGTRYADLDNAFAYRDKVPSNCSCNGRDGHGLARLDTLSDPTLRPGDIVATDTGLATYKGNSRTAEFTPISTSSSEWARRLAEVKVEPAPPLERIEPVANDEPMRPVRRGRAQAAR